MDEHCSHSELALRKPLRHLLPLLRLGDKLVDFVIASDKEEGVAVGDGGGRGRGTLQGLGVAHKLKDRFDVLAFQTLFS